MEHSIEIYIYSPNNEEDYFDEVELEVTFDLDNDGSYEITNYYLDNRLMRLSEIKEHNPNIEKYIANKIEHYITNYEPDYFDCE
jgi:hypothetical protein